MSDRISRREFIKGSLGVAGALSVPTIINYLGQSSPSSDKEFLEIRDGNFYLGGEEFTIKGANYLTRDHPWRMFDEYDPEQVDKELGIASQMGINTVRVPIRYYRAIDLEEFYEKPISYTEPDEQYFSNFNDFLDIAEENDIKVMPIALDIIYWEHFMPSTTI